MQTTYYTIHNYSLRDYFIFYIYILIILGDVGLNFLQYKWEWLFMYLDANIDGILDTKDVDLDIEHFVKFNQLMEREVCMKPTTYKYFNASPIDLISKACKVVLLQNVGVDQI